MVIFHCYVSSPEGIWIPSSIFAQKWPSTAGVLIFLDLFAPPILSYTIVSFTGSLFTHGTATSIQCQSPSPRRSLDVPHQGFVAHALAVEHCCATLEDHEITSEILENKGSREVVGHRLLIFVNPLEFKHVLDCFRMCWIMRK